jgi:short-subunit dehydrogenase
VNVIVTGASSGIGAATALAFAEAGATVGLCARREDRQREVLERCRKTSPDSRMWTADLGQLDTLAELIARMDDDLGGADVLVNNAGVPKRKRVRAMTPEDVEGVMAMNYFSPVRLTLAMLPRMIERGHGHIVNVSSMGVHSAAFGVGAYSASKAALELFTESMYLELDGTGVHAHLFVPGTTRTEFTDDKPGNEPSMSRNAPDAATAEDVAVEIVRAVDHHGFVSYASPREHATAEAKAKDVNGFLAMAREQLKRYL